MTDDSDRALWQRYLDAPAELPPPTERDPLSLAESLPHPERFADDPGALEALEQTRRLLTHHTSPSSDTTRARALRVLAPPPSWLRRLAIAAALLLAWLAGHHTAQTQTKAPSPPPEIARGSGSTIPDSEDPTEAPTHAYVVLDDRALDHLSLDAIQTAHYATLRDDTRDRARALRRAITVSEDALLRASLDGQPHDTIEHELTALHTELVRVRRAFVRQLLAGLTDEQRQRLAAWLRARAARRALGALWLRRFDADRDGVLSPTERAALRADAIERARQKQ